MAAMQLGTLERLPRELRDHIYQLAIDPCDEDVNLHSYCKPHIVLATLSKAIQKESLQFIEDAKKAPCSHTRFSIGLPPSHLSDESL